MGLKKLGRRISQILNKALEQDIMDSALLETYHVRVAQ